MMSTPTKQRSCSVSITRDELKEYIWRLERDLIIARSGLREAERKLKVVRSRGAREATQLGPLVASVQTRRLQISNGQQKLDGAMRRLREM